MITAQDVLRSLDARSRAAEMSRIDGLLQYQLTALEKAVRRLPPGTHVDVQKLIAEARAAQPPETRGDAERYRRLLESMGTSPSRTPDQAEHEVRASDQPRRRIRRRRRRPAQSETTPEPEQQRAAAPKQVLGPKVLAAADRPMGCPVDADYEKWRSAGGETAPA